MERTKFTPAQIVEEAKAAAQRCHEGKILIYGADVSPMIGALDADEQGIFARVFLDQIQHIQRGGKKGKHG